MAKQQYRPSRRPSRDDDIHKHNVPLPTSRPYTPASDSAGDALGNIDDILASTEAQNRSLRQSLETKDVEETSDSLGAEDLREAEESPDSVEESEAEITEQEKLGKGFKKEPAKAGLRGAISNVKSYRKLGVGMGVLGIVVAFAIAFLSFLLPFKLTHLIDSIEQRVGNVPQYAVERRIEFYMSRYLMIRALEETGDFDFSEDGPDRNRFTYLGDGFWKTMYTNWKGAKLENTLTTKYGIKVRADVNPELFNRNFKVRANQFSIEITDSRKSQGIRAGPLNRTETRDFIKSFARAETRSLQVFKRYHIRKVLKNYYGVGKWRWFENAIDEKKNSYYEKKRNFQRGLIDSTVGRLSDRYALYMDCLLGDTTTKSCRDVLKKADPDINLTDADRKNSGLDDAGELVDDLTPESGTDSVVRRQISKQISDKLAEFGIKKTTQYLATSVVGGIGIIEALDTVYKTLGSGVLNQVIYDKNAQQYAAYAAPILSAADQIRSGEGFTLTDVRVAQEVFDDYDESSVYQAGVPNSGSVDAAGGIYKDCDGDESNGKETLLDPGETVCPNKRLVQNKTTFTDSEGWRILGSILAPYRNTIGKIVGGLTKAVGAVTDALGINGVIAGVADYFGISEAAAKLFGILLNRVAGPVATGAEVSGDAYDNLFAGMAVMQSSVGGEVGASKEDTIGGGYMSDRQVNYIREEQMAEYNEELKQKSFFARYFSPSVKESLTGQLAMRMPSNVGATGQRLASVLTNPFGIIGSLGKTFSPRAGADTVPQTNPFHAINMGFAANHEIFTANDEEGMDPDVLHAKYHCDLPVNERPQNKAFGKPDNLPFEVPTESDPCLLEQAALDAGTRYFDGSFDEGISGATASPAPTTSAGATVVGDPTSESESVQCAPGTNDVGIHPSHNDGTSIAARICAIPTITSSSLESQPGNLFSIDRADGKLLVNSRVSGAVLAMSQAAANNGIVMKAASGWRSYAHQVALWYQNGQNTRYVARPGFSNHEAGAAIDFELSNGTKKDTSSCANKATSAGDPLWEWLVVNAARYGFGQYAAESWHWDATTSDRICR